jgi:penicillin-insensitive murein endopeptidase
MPFIAAAAWVACGAEVARADAAVEAWARMATPAVGEARSIGGYSAGCLRGGEELPLSGVGFQRMRPSRGRGFGHPQLAAYLRDLGARAKKARLGDVLVGDLGQPRGGPAPSGHASHQTGLDADIWFWTPKNRQRRWTAKDRETFESPAVVSSETKARTKHWSPRVGALLRIAADDARVARIFVNPLIKRELCAATAPAERAWLVKLRPWWGHDTHFHVRLHCPADSPDCTPQDPIGDDHGCDLSWWLDESSASDRAKGREGYRDRVRAAPTLPLGCDELVEPGAAAPASGE